MLFSEIQVTEKILPFIVRKEKTSIRTKKFAGGKPP